MKRDGMNGLINLSSDSFQDSIVKSKVGIPLCLDETIDWENVIKEEARGINDYDLGEVQEINEQYVITKKE